MLCWDPSGFKHQKAQLGVTGMERLVMSASQKPEEEQGPDCQPPSVCLCFPPNRKLTAQFLALCPVMTESRGRETWSPPMGLSQAYPEDPLWTSCILSLWVQIGHWQKACGDLCSSPCPAGVWAVSLGCRTQALTSPSPHGSNSLQLYPSGLHLLGVDWPSLPGACGFTREAVPGAKGDSTDRGGASGWGQATHKVCSLCLLMD